ncbi:MAG TPA: aminotransferase class III-fold pyridoxal phosphate-dependent enzyme [Blastocatellia bacterium]|nr:aminotransferase class III-fold pyridoxal phosphate-dependent enzyme [Blastocatellia bacterium]
MTSPVIHDQAQPRPSFSESDAARLALELYGLSVSAKELTSERDQNFLVRTGSGEQLVLKIAAVAERRETLEFQNAVMRHLQGRVRSGFIPNVCETNSGEEIAVVNDENRLAHFVRLLTYLPASLLAEVNPHTPELLRSLGMLLGQIDEALDEFSHPAMGRDLKWDLQGALWIKDYVEHIGDPRRREIVAHFIRQFEGSVVAQAAGLRTSVVHNDANDYNVLVTRDGAGNTRVAGIIDFGDMLHTYTASEVAVAAAYAMLDKIDPLAAAAQIVAGYHEVFPLTELELEVLYPLICMRLAVSVTNSALQQKLHPDNEYLLVSERPAWELLERFYSIAPPLPHYLFRLACKLEPCPRRTPVVDWIERNLDQIGPVVDLKFGSPAFRRKAAAELSELPPEGETTNVVVLDLSVGSLEFGDLSELADTRAFTASIFRRMKEAGARVGIGRYDEARLLYTSEVFATAGGESRTIHIGLDLFMQAGSPVFAPLKGVIHSFANNDAPLDYGPTIILEHEVDGGRAKFFTLYGHLSEDSLEGLCPGKPIRRGDRIASIGAPPTNGGWPPHLHFQIITDMLGMRGDFPGVAPASQREVWLSICPDPNLILGIPDDAFPAHSLNSEEILDLRRKNIGPSLSVAYSKPLHIVKGFMQYLYNAEGRRYLDAVNNVAHVGHCHPRVVRAAEQQMRALNTNTRYLHENLVRFAERLTATMPDPLKVCFFVNSGSEANELALRLARAHTKAKEIICVDVAYHGNTTSLIDISPYKFDSPGGSGARPHVHKVMMPDTYRGPYGAEDANAGQKYAAHVQQAIEEIGEAGKNLSAFICESALGCGGQIILPDGYLKEAFAHVRRAGGVCIADEVQTGLGRVGSHFWAFETQGVVPDIVTIGKPLGNGHPLAAVVATPEIAASFDNGMEYFNTFGGNPVSCAVGLAVLDVIEEEGLQENASKVGALLTAGLEELKRKHALIGDVRGMGLFIGVELVLDRETLEPAPREAAYIAERMKECGILISTDGPLHNVLKIKPPLVFSEANADELIRTLNQILRNSFLDS